MNRIRVAAAAAVLALVTGCWGGHATALSTACQHAVAAQDAHVRQTLARYPIATAAVQSGAWETQGKLIASVRRACPATVHFTWLRPGGAG
jgi:hypothetical protein